jgi:signal transduction histidine kinase
MLGTLRVGTPLTTTVPINRRFLNTEGYLPALGVELELDLEFHQAAQLTEPASRVTLPFMARGDTLGYISYHGTDEATYLSHIGKQFSRVGVFLLFCTLLIMSWPLFRLYRGIRPVLISIVLIVAHIWLLRYTLYFMGFAELVFPASMLDPAYFASTFGGGITDSAGELLLSACAILLSAVFFYKIVLDNREKVLPRTLAAIVFLLIFLTLPFVLRSFAASLRSFVVDSTFNFDDIGGLLEQPMYLVMLGNIYLLSLSLGFVLLGYYLLVKQTTRTFQSVPIKTAVLIGGVLAGIVVLITTTTDLLLPLWTYIAFALLFSVPVIVRVPPIRGRSESLLAPFVVTVVVGALMTLSLLSHFMEVKRASEIEAIAIDLSRPVDGWSQVLMEQTLQYVSRIHVENIPATGRPATLDYEAAFRIWSGSPLSRLQNNSAILLLDSTHAPISRFAVGNDPFLLSMHTLSSTIENTEGLVQSTYRWQETRGRRYYRAYTDISTGRFGSMLAVVILEALDPMQMTRQSVDLLRSTPSNLSLAPEDNYIISRFLDGDMLQSTDRSLERSIGLPADVRASVAEHRQTVWSTLAVDGEALDSYFMVIPDSDNEVLAITRGKSVPILSIYRGLRIVLLYLAFSALLLGIIALVTHKYRLISRFTFARKLQLALLGVAAIPLLLVWITGRDFVVENSRREIERQVIEDLDVLRSNILERMPDSIPVSRLSVFVDDQICQEIRLRSGKDLNVYHGPDLNATSKPELYQVGLLNNRLNPLAHVNIVQRGRDVYFASEQIGDFSYHVGYSAVRDEHGKLAAVISTPTLFQRGQMEEGYLRASATIFLWITIIALLVILTSSALARQISRPLSELLHATRDITEGNLDRKLDVRGSAEIVDLMDSFNMMTTRLRQSQEELAAAERELAWKEMAKQVAHEIRNPLTPMKLAVQHLQRAWRDGAVQLGDIIEKVTHTLIDQIESLSRISDEFARFGRMPRRSMTAVDVAETLSEAVSLFRSHEEVRFDLRLENNLPPVLADREELARAFTNLLRNAMQAMQNAGHVEIGVSRNDRILEVRITDSGSGIAPELLNHIFEPNFSTKTEGMGLGLAIVKKIIDDAGGGIYIESALGTGTTVTITLPAAFSTGSE